MKGKLFPDGKIFIQYIKEQIEHLEFQSFFNQIGVKNNQIIDIWEKPDLYDYDWIELDEWEMLPKIIPKELYQYFEEEISMIQLMSCRISTEMRNLVFYVIGEEIDNFLCYGYGFVDNTEWEEVRYEFEFFMDAEERICTSSEHKDNMKNFMKN